MRILTTLLLVICATLGGAAMAVSKEPLMERIHQLEPVIGAHPPDIHSEKEFASVKKRYEDLKEELDRLVSAHPEDQASRFMRAVLQSMGHNFDYPHAWQGATDDFKAVLNANPRHIEALLGLGRLWVNTGPAHAPDAEKLFRRAQCYQGSVPLEQAQEGMFFAFYYQGKTREALRQSEYLRQTWPRNEQYQRLNEVTRAVLKRKGDDQGAAPTKVAMATCNE